jgi:hypothetical protein
MKLKDKELLKTAVLQEMEQCPGIGNRKPGLKPRRLIWERFEKHPALKTLASGQRGVLIRDLGIEGRIKRVCYASGKTRGYLVLKPSSGDAVPASPVKRRRHLRSVRGLGNAVNVATVLPALQKVADETGVIPYSRAMRAARGVLGQYKMSGVFRVLRYQGYLKPTSSGTPPNGYVFTALALGLLGLAEPTCAPMAGLGKAELSEEFKATVDKLFTLAFGQSGRSLLEKKQKLDAQLKAVAATLQSISE